MRTIRTKVYKFDELSKQAKQKAIEWYRNGGFDYEWWDCTYEDAKEIGKLMGIEIDEIYFRGFSSQGDGACFEGSYSYNENALAKVKEYAPQDEKLHQIAEGFDKVQANGTNGIYATVKHSGHYYHEYCTMIEVTMDEGIEGDEFETLEAETIDLLRAFMRWIYKSLEAEWDGINSDDAVADTIQANEYEFTQDGKRFTK